MKTNPAIVTYITLITVFTVQMTCLCAGPQVSGEAPPGENSLKGSPADLPMALSAAGKATNSPTPAFAVGSKARGPFTLMSAGQLAAKVRSSGGFYYDLLHTDEDKALAKLSRNIGHDRRKATVLICRGWADGQVELTKKFAPFIDEICVWAFTHVGKRSPEPGELLWPGLDNPFINHLRELRKAAVGIRFLPATMQSFNGEKMIWGIGKREVLFEEAEWMMFAAIGADCDGLAWYGYNDGTLRKVKRWARLEEIVRRWSDEIGAAAPVGWAKAQTGQPISALCSDDKLLVVLLNTAYMTPDSQGKRIIAPVGRPVQQTRITITPPPGVRIESATSIFGKRLKLVSGDGFVSVKHRFKGGGDMLIFDFTKDHADADKQPPANPERKLK